jgi:hypothetical protein
MFISHSNILNEATKKENEIIEQFKTKKEAKALEIKKTLYSESERISQDQTLKDYNPSDIHNKISSLNIQHKNIISEENVELTKLKKETEEELIKIMNYKPKKEIPIKEIYKDIFSNQNEWWACRVWFTLVEIQNLNIKPGDPIRIKWFDISANRNKALNSYTYGTSSERVSTNEQELQMPNLTNNFNTSSSNCLYNQSHWGANSNQLKRWNNWIQSNRPIPKN